MYAILVLQCRFSPEYVLDKMEWYEVGAALQFLHYSNRTEWEQSRMMAYVTAQVQSTKKLKPEDIIKFPWDDKNPTEKANTDISKTDIERLNNMAQAYLNTKKNAKH